jgi:hypothetical protein
VCVFCCGEVTETTTTTTHQNDPNKHTTNTNCRTVCMCVCVCVCVFVCVCRIYACDASVLGDRMVLVFVSLVLLLVGERVSRL